MGDVTHERYFLVCSEEYGVVVPVLDYGEGPTEYGRDVWEGYAKNKTEARRLAYIAWRDRKDGNGEYIEWNRSDGKHPMSGVTVEEIEPLEHEKGVRNHG